jgi:hypothetical protein
MKKYNTKRAHKTLKGTKITVYIDLLSAENKNNANKVVKITNY